jgi:hypothetical protein
MKLVPRRLSQNPPVSCTMNGAPLTPIERFTEKSVVFKFALAMPGLAASTNWFATMERLGGEK